MRSLRAWRRDEREKLRGYSLQDKLRYAWQYYKLWILGIGFALCFTAYAAFNYFTTPGDIHFYGIFSNTYAQLGPGSSFYEGFIRSAGYDLKTGVVELDCANYCKPSGKVMGNTYYEKLISMMDGGVDDVWVAEAEDVVAVGETGRLLDLQAEKTAELFAPYRERFVYCTPLREDYSKEPVPIGIDLAGTVLTGAYSAYPEGAALGVSAASQRPEQAAAFLAYLFNEADRGEEARAY